MLTLTKNVFFFPFQPMTKRRLYKASFKLLFYPLGEKKSLDDGGGNLIFF